MWTRHLRVPRPHISGLPTGNRGSKLDADPRFVADSPPEGDGFELSVPGRETVKPSWETGLLSRKRERICWGTEGSNPSPSSAESCANPTAARARAARGGPDEGTVWDHFLAARSTAAKASAVTRFDAPRPHPARWGCSSAGWGMHQSAKDRTGAVRRWARLLA